MYPSYRAFEGAKWTNVTVDTLCDVMSNNDIGIPLARLVAVNNMALKMSGEKCLDYTYESMVSIYFTILISIWDYAKSTLLIYIPK